MADLDRALAGMEGRGPKQQARPAFEAPRGDIRDRRAAPFHDPYAELKSLSREMERMRQREDGVASAGRIAGELKAMRDELRQQMNAALKREFDGLRHDIQRLATARTPASGAELGVEFERLSDAVRNLSERTDDRGVNLLRLELEQVKNSLDSLAREDTLRSVDSRWDEFDRKFSSLESRLGREDGRGSSGADLKALTSQIERINETISALPDSLSLRSLDERLQLLSGTVDHFASEYANAMPEAFGLIEQRLDEISRAIVASASAAQPMSFDPQPFERIEARVSALARQIDELMEDQPAQAMIGHLSHLAQRVDDLSARVDVPEAIVERLGQQISDIAARMDHDPEPSRADAVFASLDQRFSELAELLERRQGAAMEQGNSLFRELESRLDEVSQKIEARRSSDTGADASMFDAIEQRFADLTARLQGNAAEDRTAIVGLETRLDDISRRLENSARRVEGMDPEVIRSLEAQVAALSDHLTRPGRPLPEFEDLAPRLDHIEQSLAGSRDAMVEAARRAAMDAVASLDRSAGDPASLAGFAADLQALEAMSRKSDERNAKTFEAIHDMLLKVVDRLGSLERSEPKPAPHMPHVDAAPVAAAFRTDEPEADTWRSAGSLSPAEAAVAAASHAMGEPKAAAEPSEGRRSMLSGLTRAFRKEKEAPTATEADAPVEPAAPDMRLDEPLDPKLANQPLEPGSGAPDLTAIVRRVREEAGSIGSAEAAKSDFIAAARRAAQAAAAEAQTARRGSESEGTGGRLKLGELLKNRRKSVLMAATGLLVVLGGWQLGSAFLSGGQNGGGDVAAVAPAPVPEPAPLVAQAELEDDLEEYAQTGTPEWTPPVRVLDPQPVDSADIAMNAPAGERFAAGDDDDEPVSALPDTGTEMPFEMARAVPASGMAAAPVEAGPVALREAADGGDPKAMFEIASRYADGRGVDLSLQTAAEWYRRSAEMGYAPAQYRLGNLYEKGNGLERDPEQAMIWYEKAAKQGNASAMHNLAVLSAMGASGAPDNDGAARWFLEAAELGVTDSQYNLGILSAKGAGVPQSLEESYKWFALVAKTGDRDAASKRDEVAKALRPDQLAKAKAATELWKPREVDAETNVVDIPEEWTEGQQTTASVEDTRLAIRNIQAILTKNGYDAGAPDGVMGNKTRSAIMAFQSDNGMAADGEISEPLIKALLDRR